MPRRKKLSLLLVKEEVTYGTDPAPVPGSNSILVADLDVKVDGDRKIRDFDRPSLSPLPHVVGFKTVKVSFSTELKGSGSANVGGAADVPEIDPLLLGCGFAKTLTAESTGGAGDGDVTYDPASQSLKSVTMWAYLDGVLHKITGAVGSFSINLKAGEFGVINWEFQGLYATPTDAAIPAGAVYDAEIPKPFFNANFSIGAYSAIIESLSFDLANEIAMRKDCNAAQGIAGFLIAGRDTQGSMNPEAVNEATHPFWADWEAGNAKALTATVGDTAGAKIDITAPKVQLREVTHGDRESVRTYETPLTLAQNAGDDEVKLKFY